MNTPLISDISSKITTRQHAFDFLKTVLATTYPVAIWRLPHTSEVWALIDLSSNEAIRNAEIEELDNCFIINGYKESHPTNPLVLKGDIVISMRDNGATVQVHPTLPDASLEAFANTVTRSEGHERREDHKPENHPDFEEMVGEAIEQIKAREIHKVVLSRYEDFDLTEDFDPLGIFEKLETSYPNAFCFLTQTKTFGTWMGATPEKLIAIEDDRYFSTDALAGTQVLKEGNDLTEIAWTQKEIEEQAMVCRYIIDCFKKIRLREFDEIGPKTIKAGSLVHLKTEYKVDMAATNSPLLGSTMLSLLHPTSAVCGNPRDIADAFIKTHEGYERELYAGFLGPVGFSSGTRLFVNLRCMQLFRNKARLYAGAGITEDSKPEKELMETQSKMQTLLKVLSL